VDHCLPYFRQWLFTCPLSALLLFQPLFTEISHRDQLLVPPPSVSVLSATLSLCCVLVFSSLFIVLFFCVCGCRDHSAQEAMLVYPWGGWGKTT
jgi:hypothetical protein